MPTNELKPCPFCGKDAAKITSLQGQLVVVCHSCGARGSMCQNEEGAVRWWNTRAGVTDEQFAVAVHDGDVWIKERTCRFRNDGHGILWCDAEGCDYEMDDYSPIPNYCPQCGAKVVQ